MNFSRSLSRGISAGLFAGVAAIALMPSAVAAQAIEEDTTTLDNDADLTDGEPDVAPAADNDVIIVTATKRAQTLQETPVSVSVTTGETLERAEIRDLLDLQTVAPSLRVNQLQSSANTTFFIRGFGNGANNVGVEPSVGVFIDGVYRSRSAAQINDLANVARIEVLRGPQSTLFGKNASAGIISVVTREPQFTFGGSAALTYGNYDNIVVRGDVTGPITDSVAFSVEGNYNTRDGYVDVVNLDEKINERNRYGARAQLLFDNGGALRVRAIGDYSKIDENCCFAGNVLAGPTFAATRAVGGNVAANDPFTYEAYLNQLPTNDIESYGGSLQADYEIGAFSITSITAYRELRAFNQQDVDFTSADVVSEFRDQAVDTFTQELRLTSDFDGPFNFLLGGFYFNEDVVQTSGLDNGTAARPFFNVLAGGALPAAEAALGIPQGGSFATGPLSREAFTLQNESYSVFGTVDFEVTDRITLTGGFNYTKDEKDFSLSQQSFDPLANVNLVDAFIVGQIARALNVAPGAVTPAVINGFATNPATRPAFGAITGAALNPAVNPLLALQPLQFIPPFLGVPNAVEPGQTEDDDWSYTGRIAYEVNNNINAYFTYATGFKASSVNLSRDSRPLASDFTPGPRGSLILAPSSPIRDAGIAVPNLGTGSRFAGPEESEVYELGIKLDYPGFALNVALFDQTLDGFQSNVFTGTGFALANAGEQSTRGFELDSTISPTDALVFTFALTHLDPIYDSFVNSAVGDLTGTRPAGIPSFTIATSATYTQELGSSGNLLIGRVDYYHESDTQLLEGVPGFGTFEQQRAIARNYTREVNQVNASLTFAMENGFEVTGYVRNLGDEQYLTQIFPSTAQAGSISGYPSQPRTYGVTARVRF